jgi:putative addiction module component (TIGR02574 family)
MRVDVLDDKVCSWMRPRRGAGTTPARRGAKERIVIRRPGETPDTFAAQSRFRRRAPLPARLRSDARGQRRSWAGVGEGRTWQDGTEARCYDHCMDKVHLAEILELPVHERVKLVQAIWDSVSELPEPFPLSAAERELIDRRLEAYRRDPDAASPWQEVKERILRRA